MLGLPVETGQGGFFPAFVLLLFNWGLLTFSAICLVEVLGNFQKNANFITLSESILGKAFKVLTFVVYIALFFSLTMAYIKGGGVFMSEAVDRVPVSLGSFLFLLLFVPFIVLGPKILGVGNTFLTLGLMVSFLLLIFLGITKVNPSYLQHVDWKLGFFSFPMFITAFGFHGVLPSLYSYVGSKKKLKKAILMGTSLTFLIYLSWQLMVMGIVPLEGEKGLLQTLQLDQTAITPLIHFLQSPILKVLSQIFYFTALTTSFLGVGLGLIDFLLDSFKIKQKKINRLLMAFLIYLPALWVAESSLRVFYLSLKYGGGISCLYLLVFLPILFYYKQKKAFP